MKRTANLSPAFGTRDAESLAEFCSHILGIVAICIVYAIFQDVKHGATPLKIGALVTSVVGAVVAKGVQRPFHERSAQAWDSSVAEAESYIRRVMDYFHSCKGEVVGLSDEALARLCNDTFRFSTPSGEKFQRCKVLCAFIDRHRQRSPASSCTNRPDEEPLPVSRSGT